VRVHQTRLKAGIARTKEFERKRLASFSVNVGTKCGHGCLYCSTGAVLRMHRSFAQAGENPFAHGYAIVDPDTPERVARDAERLTGRRLIQLCTLVDAWAPEALEHNLGRRCLAAILSQPGWTVRVLTKNAAVVRDFDLIEQYRDRVLVGVSVTATPSMSGVMSILEPDASGIQERMAALMEAKARGLRTYGMFCPLLPGIADSPEQVDLLIQFAVGCNVEEIFVEPVNARGPGLRLCETALREHGHFTEAEAIGKVRERRQWSQYVRALISNVQQSVERHFDLARLRVLLYPSRLLPEHAEDIRKHGAGVIWLGKDAPLR